MILDGTWPVLLFCTNSCTKYVVGLKNSYPAEVQTCPADKFRRTLSGTVQCVCGCV